MPTPVILSLGDFKSALVGHFAPGTWVVEYHDCTHLSAEPEETYVTLGQVEIEEVTPKGTAFFYFRPTPCQSNHQQGAEQPSEGIKYLESLIEEAWTTGNVGGSKNPADVARYILDLIKESAVRLGLIRLAFEIDDPDFDQRNFAVIILDTNALRSGAVRHLKEQFEAVQLWAIIPLVSLMEIGERSQHLAGKAEGKPKRTNSALLRVRPQTTIAPHEVKWIKERFPTETLELAPELLRTFRGYETGRDKEPDRISMNDRLILEGIKDLRRQRGLPEGVYLMSGDKNMSRLARLEGIHTIYPAVPAIQSFPNGIYSIRFSLEARIYIVCSIHRFLWDLTHVFSKIRARCISGKQKGRALELSYYFPTKLVNDWIDDKLEVTDLGSSFAPDSV